MARAMAMRWRWPPENSCGVAPAGVGIQPDLGQRPSYPASRSAGGERRLVDLQPLRDDLGDGHARAERAEGILEDDLQAITQRPHLLERVAADVAPMKAMRPSDEIRRSQREAERRLARAGFAHHAQRFAGGSDRLDAVDRLDVIHDPAHQETRLDREPDTNILPFQHDRLGWDPPPAASPFGSRTSRWRV
jgi:hypothetical protein